MRVAINCRSFSLPQYAGIGRYTYNLVKSLSVLDRDNEYYLYLQKKVFDTKRKIPAFHAKNFHAKIDRLNLGIDRFIKDVDVYHSPSPDRLPPGQEKIVVTVHDLVHRFF